MKESNNTIGKRIKLIRKNLALSQELFAKELNITQQSYSLIETNSRLPNFKIATILGEKFNVNLNWLILGHGEIFRGFSENLDVYKIKTQELKNLITQIDKIFKDFKYY